MHLHSPNFSWHHIMFSRVLSSQSHSLDPNFLSHVRFINVLQLWNYIIQKVCNIWSNNYIYLDNIVSFIVSLDLHIILAHWTSHKTYIELFFYNVGDKFWIQSISGFHIFLAHWTHTILILNYFSIMWVMSFELLSSLNHTL